MSLSPSPGQETLDALARRTRQLDFAAGLLAAPLLAVIEMGPALAKKAYGASDLEIAIITSGQCLGLLLTFFTAHLASRGLKKAVVLWPEVLARLAVAAMFFVRPDFALGFVALHTLAQMLQAMTIPARVTIYRLNYPSTLRGRIVGRNRQVQLVLTTVMALALSAILEWSAGHAELARLLGPAPAGLHGTMASIFPLVGAAGVLGCCFFAAVPVRAESRGDGGELPATLLETARRFWRVWRADRAFRRYESFFLVFGFANIMSIPLTQIHAVDALHADYFDLALINVVLVSGLMGLTMAFWGRVLDRQPPTRLRGLLNLIFAVDFLAFALSPSLGWIFVGRACRGIALGGGTLVWMLGSLYYARSSAEAPVYLGIHTVLTGLRWLVAPFAGVWLKDLCGADARPAFFLSFVLVAASAVWMLIESRHERPRPLGESAMPAPRTPGA